MLSKINEAGVLVLFERIRLFANYLNWSKQSQRSKTSMIMSYQKLLIHFYSKNGELMTECSITKIDIVKIIIKVTIG